MKFSEIEHIQVIVRIRGKYYLVLMDAATQKLLPDWIAGVEGQFRVLEIELPFEEISMNELKRLTNMKQGVKNEQMR